MAIVSGDLAILRSGDLAIVPAAGKSERFGRMKLLADVGGERLLDRTLRSLLDAGVATVVVVLAPGAALDEVRLFRDARVKTVVNPDPSRGMFSSLLTGLAAAEGDPIVILPADMPFVRPATIADVIREATVRQACVVAAHEGRRGHPLVLPGRLRSALLSAPPGGSLRHALQELDVEVSALETHDAGVLRDVDYPRDLGEG